MSNRKTPATGEPRFPSYLLPSWNFPFPVRRPGTASVADSNREVPSLSKLSTDSAAASDPATPSSSSPASFPPDLTSAGSPWDSKTPQKDKGKRKSKDKARDKSKRQPESAGTVLQRTQPDTIRCSTCATDLAFGNQIASKSFMGRHGRAYLVSPISSLATSTAYHPKPFSPYGTQPETGSSNRDCGLINVRVGNPETRTLVTGEHRVADISCAICNTRVGWKYVEAKEETQKYKEGKFILEVARIAQYRNWEDVDLNDLAPRSDCEPDGEGEEETRGRGRNDRSWERNRLRGLRSRGPRGAPRDVEAEGGYGDDEDEDGGTGRSKRRSDSDDMDDDCFDSQDESECEEVFLGIWNPAVARGRRKRKGLTKRL